MNSSQAVTCKTLVELTPPSESRGRRGYSAAAADDACCLSCCCLCYRFCSCCC